MSMVGAASPAQTGRRRPSAARELIALLRPHHWGLLVILALVLGTALLALVPPVLVRWIVDDHLSVKQPSGLLLLALLYLGATAGGQLTAAASSYLVSRVAQDALHGLRMRLFTHVQELPASYFDRTSIGDVISRCTADVETLNQLFSTGVANLITSLLLLATLGVTMVVLSLPLFLVTLVILPPMVIITRYFQVQIRQAQRAERIAVGQINTSLQETLSGVEVVQAYGREEALVARFRRALFAQVIAFNRGNNYNALYPPIAALIAAAATAVLLWSGTFSIFARFSITLGTLTAYVLLFQRFFTPITDLANQWQTVQTAIAGSERIFQVLAEPTEENLLIDGSEPQARIGPTADLSRAPAALLRDVTFGYLPGQPVLVHINLRVERGEHVALIGRTGAGKSSTLHLLSGLYEPWSGEVRVAGLNPRLLTADDRRRVVGVVSQTSHLFSATVLDNLTLFDESAGRAVVEGAAALSGADAFIRNLPDGYDTILRGVGRGAGAQLSAGQQQLLALTRVLVWEPYLVMLDEATAAVDGVTDATFRAALRHVTAERGWGVLTVAHRLSTAREADRIVVLEEGRIIEEGSPEELAHTNGYFASMLALEEAGWDWRAH